MGIIVISSVAYIFHALLLLLLVLVLAPQGDNKGFLVCRSKAASSADTLCASLEEPFRKFTQAVQGLSFSEEPAYAAYISMFEPLLVSGIGPVGAWNALPRQDSPCTHLGDCECS